MAARWRRTGYELFHSAALNELVRQALAGNPDLEAARHGLMAAQFELKAVAGTALPQIDATGQVGRARVNGSFLYGPVNEISATGNRFALGPSLVYDLDLFGGVRRTIESQRAATSGVRDQVLNTYVTLVNQVVIFGFDYAATRAQIEVSRALVQELQAQFDLTQTLERAGKVTRSDSLLAQLRHNSGALSRVIDQLVHRGLLTRVRRDHDRRKVELRLTPAARGTIDGLVELVNAEPRTTRYLKVILSMPILCGEIPQENAK